MEISSILDILGKIETEGGRLKFLEKCFFEEKSDENRLKILELLRKYARNAKARRSFESYIKQLQKERRAAVVEDVFVPGPEKKKKAEPKKEEKLENILENLNKEEPESEKKDELPKKDYLPAALREAVDGAEGAYKLRETGYQQKKDAQGNSYVPRQEGYVPKEDMPSMHQGVKRDVIDERLSKEEYKKREQFMISKEQDEKKQEAYKKKLLLGL